MRSDCIVRQRRLMSPHGPRSTLEPSAVKSGVLCEYIESRSLIGTSIEALPDTRQFVKCWVSPSASTWSSSGVALLAQGVTVRVVRHRHGVDPLLREEQPSHALEIRRRNHHDSSVNGERARVVAALVIGKGDAK
jgi:hypothetical protein